VRVTPTPVRTAATVDAGRPVAVVVARDGRLPLGADEAVSEAGGSAVVATHDQQLVAAVASRVVELRDGAARERRTMAGASR